jgi:hypothetical protein
LIVAVEEEGIGRGVGGDVFRFPNHTATDFRTEGIDLIRFHKPEIGLRLCGGDFAFGFTLVKEFGFGCVITTEDHVIAPAGEVADDFQIVRARRNTGGIGAAECFRKTPQAAMHRHEEIVFADLADARPFGIPTVSAVIGMRCFWQTVIRVNLRV